ncbi:hypothetical protein A3K82_01935 [Candidatus Pacearchaeota archaeon RBG_19FT_COMBO_34_9]|nr:MAG: hypothetical protein A3K82_01935 [Candidatus Pacearchaeota archaeon RBG_19FT_COMBO_34_9]OGJ16741.1 MAG: hypothetical protein A3K74_00805 [Candidatus Pacearchaeota archaeon RBG_13_33_26]
MGIPSSDSESKRIEREERRRELMEERGKVNVERAKALLSFADINPNISKDELTFALHEELTLKQMDKDYLFFFNSIEERGEDYERFRYRFWKNQERFISKNITNYLRGYYITLKENPELFERYSKIKSPELNEQRKEGWKRYNELCIKMNSLARKYDTPEKLKTILIEILK